MYVSEDVLTPESSSDVVEIFKTMDPQEDNHKYVTLDDDGNRTEASVSSTIDLSEVTREELAEAFVRLGRDPLVRERGGDLLNGEA